MERVAHWCDENGAVLLEEVQENWEEVVGELKLEKTASPCVNQGDEATLQVPGLSEWLEEVELEEYLEDVLAPRLKPEPKQAAWRSQKVSIAFRLARSKRKLLCCACIFDRCTKEWCQEHGVRALKDGDAVVCFLLLLL